MKSNVLSFKVATTLAAYRIVAISAANTVAYPSGSTVLPIGVTLDTVKDTNQAIPVAVAGSIAKVEFNGNVSAGGLVASETDGRGTAFTLASTTTALTLSAAYVGILVGATVAASGTVADVFIMPGYESGA